MTKDLGLLIARLHRCYEARINAQLAPFGVKAGCVGPLMAVLTWPGTTQADLCRLMVVEQPTMANTLNRMERDGFIRREAHKDDKRMSLVYPTAKAVAVKDAIDLATGVVAAEASAGDADVAVLDKMIKAFEMMHAGEYDDDWLGRYTKDRPDLNKELYEADQKIIQEGLQSFALHYQNLWD